MLKKLVIASTIILLLPVAILINDQIKLNDYLPISQQTHDVTIIDPKIINYIHTRLDQRLAYEDEFKNNIVLSSFKSSEEDMPYNILAEVRDNIFLIQTSYPWLWGDYRHSVFLIKKDEETLNLLDYYIPDSINDPMEYYKVNDQGVTILSEDEKINLYFKSNKV
ncbi:hypothetical protein OAJ95_02005 [Pelagibacteraceae bacterium]|nr:hypothetical protein [Pelagibacteraceae bacterium]